ncbi:MAG: ABC transporter substrate-binding protein [Flavobacterium sp. BFFFF2]|nr:MAG: ABC transporter substrate-binding protein [Flavobacterium sp. BFFFF2]
MNICRFFAGFLLMIQVGLAQENTQWEGHYSYHNVQDIAVTNKAIYGSCENSFFTKSLINGSVKTTSTIQGISGEFLSCFYYSETYKLFLLGYENGLMVVVNETTGKVIKLVDIINKSIPSNIKKINHFLEYNNQIFLSCDFGVVQFNPSTLVFGDTYFMGPTGQEIKVLQTAVVSGKLYAATQNYGIRWGDLSSPFLNDFNQWQTLDSGVWRGVVNLNNNLIGWNSNQQLYRYQAGGWISFYSLPEAGVQIKTQASLLTAVTPNHVLVFGSNFIRQLDYTYTPTGTDPLTFNCAVTDGQTLYVGTQESGILQTPLGNSGRVEFILPDGPVRNKIFRMKKSSTALWVLYGAYNRTYNPYDPPRGLGQFPISLYKNTSWSKLPYDGLLGAKSLSNLVFNPKNENQVWVASYFSGLLKMENEQATKLYNQANTAPNGLETLVIAGNPTYVDIRVNGPAWDKNNNLWMSNNMIDKSIKVLRSSGQWQSYSVTSVFSDARDVSYGSLVVDKNNTKWIPTDRNGVLAFNENYNNKYMVIKNDETGNLPDGDVRCVAIDQKNQLWIGSTRGVRVLSSVDQFLSQNELKTRAIIIVEDGLAQELLYQQFVTDICVDGSNKKWIGTADTGLYYISADGQQTIYHFTVDNSPLPSNTIVDVEIDAINGTVFVATDRGMVSFKGIATTASSTLANVYIYPNPVRPDYEGTVKICNLTDKATVKITDIEGNLVFETTSAGGTIEWDTMAFGKYKVSSGVYVVFVSAADGSDTTVKKVMIVR